LANFSRKKKNHGKSVFLFLLADHFLGHLRRRLLSPRRPQSAKKKKKKKPQQNSAPINLGTAVLQKLGMYGGGLAICLGFRMTSVYCTVTAPGLVMSNTDSYKGSREQANTVTSCII
jgi:hypothetical protein